MADRDFNIEIVGAPSLDEVKGPVGSPTDPTVKKPNTSWWYNNVGVAITQNDREDRDEKNFIKEEEYEKYWNSLTDSERFSLTRDKTIDEGRPSDMTIETWQGLEEYQRAYYRARKLAAPFNIIDDMSMGITIGAKDTVVNAFSLPLALRDVIQGNDEATTQFFDVINRLDPLQPQNSAQEIISLFTRFGAPAVAVVNWINKFKRSPGFWNALKRYSKTMTAVGATDAIVSGPGDTNLATAFGPNAPIPFEQFLTIHEDDPSLIRRVKIGAEMYYVGPMVDTALMIGGGMYKGGRFLLGGANTNKKIEFIDINGNKQEFFTNERTFQAVANILNDIVDGPRTIEQIEEGLKLFENSNIIPTTGAVTGSPGLIQLGKIFNSGNFSDQTVRNLLAMNQDMHRLLVKNGYREGINSTFLTKEVRQAFDNVNEQIAKKQAALDQINLEKTGSVSEATIKATESESIIKGELSELKNQRKAIETQIKEDFTNQFNAAKDEVKSYIDTIGAYNPGVANQLGHSLDQELINQLAYLTYYKNQLYKNVDLNPNTQTKISHNLKTMGVENSDKTVFELFTVDVNRFIKKQDPFDVLYKDIPSYLVDELKTLINKKQTAPLTIKRIEELRATFSRAYSDAISANAFQLADRIIASKNQIFTNLYDNIGRASDDEFRLMAENSKAANEWFATQYAPRFDEGVASMWAEAFKKRKSGSLNSSSPEQTPLFFLKNDGRGLYINNSAESGINLLKTIIEQPKDALGKPLMGEFVDPNTQKKLNVADVENVNKIVENFMAAKIAQALSGTSSADRALTILTKFQDNYSSVLNEYPNVAKQIEEYKTVIKEKEETVASIAKQKEEATLIEKETSATQLAQKQDQLNELKVINQKNKDAINLSFNEKVDLAREELKNISNQKNNNANLFSFFVNDTPVNAINKAMNSADPEGAMAKIKAEIDAADIPRLNDGLRDAVSEWVKTQIQTKKIIQTTDNVPYPDSTLQGPLVVDNFKFEADLQGLIDLLKQPNKLKALQEAGWSPDDIATLTKYSDQLITLERAALDARGSTKAEIIDPGQTLRKTQILAASIYGIVKGRGITTLMSLLGSALGLSPFKAQQLLLTDAMAHPELAKILLQQESDRSIDLLKTYIFNNYITNPDARETFMDALPLADDRKNPFEGFVTDEDRDDRDFNIEPQARGVIPDPLNVTLPTVNQESRLASTDLIQPVNMIRTGTTDTGTTIDPNRAAIAFGPDDLLAQPRMAARGGIMNTKKAFQRVA